mgnify:FL=1
MKLLTKNVQKWYTRRGMPADIRINKEMLAKNMI